MIGKPIRGLVIGKFMPPHLGHKYLIDFARGMVDELTVLVCTLKRQPVPGQLRHEWMSRSFGGVRVLHHTDENPEEPQDADSPEQFWSIWKESILSYLSEPPDIVFASEPYGITLAQVLGAVYVPVDHQREHVPISGSAIREGIHPLFDYILPAARPYFTRRVAVIGPESSGKSTLAQDLAERYGASCVAEYGRTYLEATPHQITDQVLTTIALGQRASEDALAEQCGGLLFCDTEAIVTKLWARFFTGSVPDVVERLASENCYDLYLVTRATEEWVENPQRFHPEFARRQQFSDDCIAELANSGRPYAILDGTWSQRWKQATAAVDSFLSGSEKE
jgi:NadR type nicotinamide-nucleotide adenylyltransferase